MRCSARRRETSSPARTSPAQLGISRAAVWKAVGALRRDGYTIEAQTGLGYRLADSPDVLSERELRRRLGETKTVGRTLHCFESVDSTNSYLKRIAAEGAPDGAVAVADEQTAGRGRRGRSFSSSPGRGVYPLSAAAPAARAGEDTAAHGARRGGGLRCGGAHLRRAAAD